MTHVSLPEGLHLPVRSQRMEEIPWEDLEASDHLKPLGSYGDDHSSHSQLITVGWFVRSPCLFSGSFEFAG